MDLHTPVRLSAASFLLLLSRTSILSASSGLPRSSSHRRYHGGMEVYMCCEGFAGRGVKEVGINFTNKRASMASGGVVGWEVGWRGHVLEGYFWRV